MSKRKKQNKQSRQILMGAIAVATIMLVVLIAIAIDLISKEPTGDGTEATRTDSTVSVVPADPTQPDSTDDNQPSGDVVTPSANVPTESNPLMLDQGLYVVHMGNYSGRFVEDGSDVQVDNFCAVIVENRSESTLQLLQFTISDAEHEYTFQLTTLPPGERAIVQDMNRTPFVNGNGELNGNVDLCVFFDKEPSLHEDIFVISGTETGIELRNRTDSEISGPIYVYYKTRTADGFFGGITYRVTISGLGANGIFSTAVNHFWPGSSQVMFIDYVQ